MFCEKASGICMHPAIIAHAASLGPWIIRSLDHPNYLLAQACVSFYLEIFVLCYILPTAKQSLL